GSRRGGAGHAPSGGRITTAPSKSGRRGGGSAAASTPRTSRSRRTSGWRSNVARRPKGAVDQFATTRRGYLALSRHMTSQTRAQTQIFSTQLNNKWRQASQASRKGGANVAGSSNSVKIGTPARRLGARRGLEPLRCP